jgi:hypothetical protein
MPRFRSLSLVTVLVLAAPALLHCVGDDPAVRGPDPVDGGSPGDETTPGTDRDAGGADGAQADAGCPTGFATCGGGPVCGTNVATDPDQCGACGHACMGSTCAAGRCQPVAIASGFPRPHDAPIGNGLVLLNDDVFFVTTTRVYRVAKDAKGDPSVAATMLHEGSTPRFLSAPGQLFWSNGSGSNTTILAMLPNAAPNSATPFETGQNGPQGVVSDGTFVYWGVSAVPQDMAVIRRKGINGAPTADVVTGQVAPRHIAVGGGNLYWDLSVSSGNALRMSPAGGGTIKPIVSLEGDHVSAIVLSQTHVYWVTNDLHEVWRATIAGDSPEKLHTGATSATSAAIDATHLYVGFEGDFGNQFKDGVVVRFPLAGGPAEPVAHLPFVQGLATDADFVYVLGGDATNVAAGGALWRVRK